MDIPGYGKVYNLGHPDIALLLHGSVVMQEKYDGSQLSWAWDADGVLHARSKGKRQLGDGVTIDEADKLFRPALAHLLTVEPIPGPIFRGEALASARHNTLTYDRVPRGNVVLFDVELAAEFTNSARRFSDNPWHYAVLMGTEHYAVLMGTECATLIGMEGGQPMETLSEVFFKELLETESSLGGPKVEGIVIKNYNRFNVRDGRPLMGKYVSEHFKEVHKRSWSERNPTRGDILEGLIASLNTEARWEKAVQHLRESGELEGTPRDIGALMREVKADVMEEERAWVIERLIAAFLPAVERGLGRGLPEWYKLRLAAAQFTEGES